MTISSINYRSMMSDSQYTYYPPIIINDDSNNIGVEFMFKIGVCERIIDNISILLNAMPKSSNYGMFFDVNTVTLYTVEILNLNIHILVGNHSNIQIPLYVKQCNLEFYIGQLIYSFTSNTFADIENLYYSYKFRSSGNYYAPQICISYFGIKYTTKTFVFNFNNYPDTAYPFMIAPLGSSYKDAFIRVSKTYPVDTVNIKIYNIINLYYGSDSYGGFYYLEKVFGTSVKNINIEYHMYGKSDDGKLLDDIDEYLSSYPNSTVTVYDCPQDHSYRSSSKIKFID